MVFVHIKVPKYIEMYMLEVGKIWQKSAIYNYSIFLNLMYIIIAVRQAILYNRISVFLNFFGKLSGVLDYPSCHFMIFSLWEGNF